jgi:hypothetical protein
MYNIILTLLLITNCVSVLFLLWLLDKKKAAKYTKEEVIKYSQDYSAMVIEKIKEKSQIPSQISFEDYATYVKVHNAWVMHNRLLEAERQSKAKQATEKIIEMIVTKKDTN